MLRVLVLLSLFCLTVSAAVNKTDTDRIVGGKTALIKDFPYVVSVQRRDVHICGGSILSVRFILTAAHCIVPLNKVPIVQASIRAGSTIWSAGGQQIGVQKMAMHSKYDAETKVYDIGVLKLLKPLEFDITVQPIELATKIPGDGREGVICGWGLKKEKADLIPNMLQQAVVASISREKCSSSSYEYGADIKESMICAQNPGIDACQGDSGGPYVINNKLVGVTSFGRGCGRKEYPGIYCAVASVLKWISRTTENL